MNESAFDLFKICFNSLWLCRKNNTLDKESFIQNVQKNDPSITREEIELMLKQPLNILLEIKDE